MTHPRKFRFAVQLSKAPDGTARSWAEQARKAEDLGYSTLLMPDHFGDQLAPVPALMAAAAATSTLRLGTLVFDNDYRHPVVLAKEAATVDLLTEQAAAFYRKQIEDSEADPGQMTFPAQRLASVYKQMKRLDDAAAVLREAITAIDASGNPELRESVSSAARS